LTKNGKHQDNNRTYVTKPNYTNRCSAAIFHKWQNEKLAILTYAKPQPPEPWVPIYTTYMEWFMLKNCSVYIQC